MIGDGAAASTNGHARFPILLYHRIRADTEPIEPFDVAVGTFRRQMDRLAASGRDPRTIGDLLDGSRAVPDRAAAVTFDDGTADFYDLAWPILRERGIPVTLYVTSGLVGRRHGDSEMLSWRQLEELRDGDVEIGAHGYRHVPLDLLSLDRAALELVNSKIALEDGLQRRVGGFAYPYGYHTHAIRRLLPRVGYTSACGVKNRLSHPHDDRYALARMTITEQMPAERFEELLRGRGARGARDGERLRTRLWRAYRHAQQRTTPAGV